MKILYAANLAYGDSAKFRLWALERLGHTIVPVDLEAYQAASPLLRKLEFRLAAGPAATRLNRDLLHLAETEKPDLFWADKVLKLQPSTLRRMRALGVMTVSYMIDNAFGPRQDPGWRLYRKDIPYFDLHITQRDCSIPDYTSRGAANVIKIQTAYERTIHFPPPPGWSDLDRTREVSFLGAPYDDRAQTLAGLARSGIAVTVSGLASSWRKALSPATMNKLYFGGLLYEKEYREAIWGSKINLSFLTRANLDEFTHKSFEIAGCGGFLLAERCPGHSAKFVEDHEAVFFSNAEELRRKILRYLPDEAARSRIAAAGHARAVRDGYDNDHQIALILAALPSAKGKPGRQPTGSPLA